MYGEIIAELIIKKEIDLAMKLAEIERSENNSFLDEVCFKNQLSILQMENNKLRFANSMAKEEIKKLNRIIDGLGKQK